jgi:DNA-binding CsgD family transcriptional regulator
MSAKAANGHQCRTKIQGTSRGFEGLVRRLVARAREAAPACQPQPPAAREEKGTSDEVLFDCEVDGVRCVLARTSKGQADDLSLSPREQEIARMIAKGYPNKTIAAVLDISIWTVSTHLRRVFAKFSVNSRAAMVAKMIQRRML